MSRKPRQIPLEPADTSPQGWALWWFAMGQGEPGTVRKLTADGTLEADEAQAVFRAMRTKIADDIQILRTNVVAQSARLFRSIKSDRAADWGSRQRAQLELEKLLDLVAFAQTPEGSTDDEVHEAIAFHNQLLEAAGPTNGQKLRSQKRLLQLLGIQLRPGRRAGTAPRSNRLPGTDAPNRIQPVSEAASDRYPHAHDERGQGTWDDGSAGLDAAPHIARPVISPEVEFDAEAQQQLLQQLEAEESALDAEFDRLVESGVSPDDAIDQLEPRMHDNGLRQIALRQIQSGIPLATVQAVMSATPPEPHAQGPPG